MFTAIQKLGHGALRHDKWSSVQHKRKMWEYQEHSLRGKNFRATFSHALPNLHHLCHTLICVSPIHDAAATTISVSRWCSLPWFCGILLLSEHQCHEYCKLVHDWLESWNYVFGSRLSCLPWKFHGFGA